MPQILIKKNFTKIHFHFEATEILVGNGELEPNDLEGGGPFSPIELCGTESTMEVLQMLKGTLEGLDAELDGLYAKFTVFKC